MGKIKHAENADVVTNADIAEDKLVDAYLWLADHLDIGVAKGRARLRAERK